MSIPQIEDFVATEDPEQDLDGYHAWKNLGGLSVEAAYAKFLEEPEVYQEDFMWMGDRAFVYYFAVLEKYLRTDEPKDEFDGATHILAHCIELHVRVEGECVRPLYSRIVKLCDFVLEGLRPLRNRTGRCDAIQEMELAWSELRAKALSLRMTA